MAEVGKVVQEQTERYFHGMSNIVTHKGYVALGRKLNALVPVKGSEALRHIHEFRCGNN